MTSGFALVVVGAIGALPLSYYTKQFITYAFGEDYGAASSAALWLLSGTWLFGAVSGWLNFACVITSRKFAGSFIYFVWAVVVAVGGLFWGWESATNMAVVSAMGMGSASLFGWIYYMRRDSWFDTK